MILFWAVCCAGNRKFNLDLDSISKRYGGDGKASRWSLNLFITAYVLLQSLDNFLSITDKMLLKQSVFFKQQRLALHKSATASILSKMYNYPGTSRD